MQIKGCYVHPKIVSSASADLWNGLRSNEVRFRSCAIVRSGELVDLHRPFKRCIEHASPLVGQSLERPMESWCQRGRSMGSTGCCTRFHLFSGASVYRRSRAAPGSSGRARAAACACPFTNARVPVARLEEPVSADPEHRPEGWDREASARRMRTGNEVDLCYPRVRGRRSGWNPSIWTRPEDRTRRLMPTSL